jgi:hypothetical protein
MVATILSFLPHGDKLGAASQVNREWYRAARSPTAWVAVYMTRSEADGPLATFLVTHPACRRLHTLAVAPDTAMQSEYRPLSRAQVDQLVLCAPYRPSLRSVSAPWPADALVALARHLPDLVHVGIAPYAHTTDHEYRMLANGFPRLQSLAIPADCPALPTLPPSVHTYCGPIRHSDVRTWWEDGARIVRTAPLHRIVCTDLPDAASVYELTRLIQRHPPSELTIRDPVPYARFCLAVGQWAGVQRLQVSFRTANAYEDPAVMLPPAVDDWGVVLRWGRHAFTALDQSLAGSAPYARRGIALRLHIPHCQEDRDIVRMHCLDRLDQWHRLAPGLLRRVDITVCPLRASRSVQCDRRCQWEEERMLLCTGPGQCMPVRWYWHSEDEASRQARRHRWLVWAVMGVWWAICLLVPICVVRG